MPDPAEPALNRYAIALGSNRLHGRHGPPAQTLAAALAALARAGTRIEGVARIRHTAPLGPSIRRFANSAAIVATSLPPRAFLALLKDIERAFGRRRGRRWGARVLDLDILLWSGGAFATRTLVIPHPALGLRAFVLEPLAQIAPRWRTPRGARVAHLRARLVRPRVDPPAPAP